MERQSVRTPAPEQRRCPQRHQPAQRRRTQALERLGPGQPGESGAVARVADQPRQLGCKTVEPLERLGRVRGDGDASGEPALVDRAHHPGFDPRLLEVDVEPDRLLGEQFERVLEPRGRRRRPLAGVAEDEAGADVELDQIGPDVHRGPQTLERVGRRHRGSAAMADHEYPRPA